MDLGMPCKGQRDKELGGGYSRLIIFTCRLCLDYGGRSSMWSSQRHIEGVFRSCHMTPTV